MTKAVVVLLAGTETHADMGYAANALETVQQFKDAGDEVVLLFDGAGTQWVPKLTDEEHKMNPAYEAVADKVGGACEFCANAFHVIEEIRASEVDLVDEHNQHPSLHKYVADGYEVITF